MHPFNVSGLRKFKAKKIKFEYFIAVFKVFAIELQMSHFPKDWLKITLFEMHVLIVELCL